MRKHPRDRPMTDRELTGKLLEVLLICLVGIAIYIFKV